MTMDREEDSFKSDLNIKRAKLKMLLYLHLNAVVDAIILEEEPVLPIPFRSGYLEYSKNSDKFDVYLETMIEILANLLTKQVRTKRDMYYGNGGLYKKQAVLDAAVANLSNTFSVPRDALNVVGAAKGIYFGNIAINGNQMAKNQLSLIPRREEIDTINLLDVKFILVIEKDAVMNVIIDNYAALKDQLGSFLMVSGKGFPCMRTKQFMNLLETEFPLIPKCILVDNDPYGIDIALNYVSCSKNENDSCPSIQYIGVDHFDLDKYGSRRMTESLTVSDLRRLEAVGNKAKALNRFRELDEIKFMKNNLKKSEIESLYNPDCKTFCLNFLVDKLQGLQT